MEYVLLSRVHSIIVELVNLHLLLAQLSVRQEKLCKKNIWRHQGIFFCVNLTPPMAIPNHKNAATSCLHKKVNIYC